MFSRFKTTSLVTILALILTIIITSTSYAAPAGQPLPHKKFVIISIDGGGIRGIVAARILEEIERRTGKRIYQMADLIAGNSTGGIIALALVTPDATGKSAQYSAKDLVTLYKERGREIFPKSYWWKIKTGWGLWGAKYDRSGLDEILNEKFGLNVLSKTIKPVVIISYSLDRSEPHFWTTRLANTKSYKDFLLRDVAAATSAAPTYFKPKELYDSNGGSCKREYSDLYIAPSQNYEEPYVCYEADGGVFNNNPSVIAIAEAYRSNPSLSRGDVMLLSIGTGKVTLSREIDDLKNSGIFGWVFNANLIDVMMNADSFISEWESEILGFDAVRLQPDLDSNLKAMDKVSKKNIKRLLRAADLYIEQNTVLIDEICKKLIAYMK